MRVPQLVYLNSNMDNQMMFVMIMAYTQTLIKSIQYENNWEDNLTAHKSNFIPFFSFNSWNIFKLKHYCYAFKLAIWYTEKFDENLKKILKTINYAAHDCILFYELSTSFFGKSRNFQRCHVFMFKGSRAGDQYCVKSNDLLGKFYCLPLKIFYMKLQLITTRFFYHHSI